MPSMRTNTALFASGAGGTATGTPSFASTVLSGRSRPQRGATRSSRIQRPSAGPGARKWQRIARIASGDSKAGLRLSNVIVASRRIVSGPSGSRAVAALRSSSSCV